MDAAFREQLLARRGEVAADIGLVLTPAESQIIAAIPRANLAATIAATRAPATAIPALRGTVAMVMLAALTTASEARGEWQFVPTLGNRPDYVWVGPKPKPNTPPPTTWPPGMGPSLAPKGTPQQLSGESTFGNVRVYLADGRKIRCNLQDDGDEYLLILEMGKRSVPKSSVVRVEFLLDLATSASQPGSQPATQPTSQTQPTTEPAPQTQPAAQRAPVAPAPMIFRRSAGLQSDEIP